MKIDPKKLSLLTGSIQPGGIFYKLEEDGSYSRCQFDEIELEGSDGIWISQVTETLKKEGKLFLRRDKPWHPIVQ